MRLSFEEVRTASVKVMDPWWVYLIMRSASVRVTWFVANYTRMRPNHISMLGLSAGVGAAVSFYVGNGWWLVVGMLSYQIAIFLDTVDGKLARATGAASDRGKFVDTMVNHLTYLFVVVAFATSPAWSSSVHGAAIALLALRAMQVVLNTLDESVATVNVHTPIHPDKDSWLRRRGLLYPMTTPDRETVMFLFGPLTGLVALCLWVGVAMDVTLAGLKVTRIWREP